MKKTNETSENDFFDFEAELDEDQKKQAEGKKVSEQELIEKYQKYYDKNKALKLLKQWRKNTRKLPGVLRGPNRVIIELLGHLISALDNEKLPVPLKAIVMGAIGYIILPLDLIPDTLLGIGFIDDILSTVGVVTATKVYSKFNLKELDDLLDAETDSSADEDNVETTEESDSKEGK